MKPILIPSLVMLILGCISCNYPSAARGFHHKSRKWVKCFEEKELEFMHLTYSGTISPENTIHFNVYPLVIDKRNSNVGLFIYESWPMNQIVDNLYSYAVLKFEDKIELGNLSLDQRKRVLDDFYSKYKSLFSEDQAMKIQEAYLSGKINFHNM